MTTLQAQRLIDALKAIGLKHGSARAGGDFTVQTERKRITSRSTGQRYTEFGNATAHISGPRRREAVAIAAEAADDLARQGLTVFLIFSSTVEGEVVDTIVSSRHNPYARVSEFRNGTFTDRRTKEVA
jgi:hypothetical protein